MTCIVVSLQSSNEHDCGSSGSVLFPLCAEPRLIPSQEDFEFDGQAPFQEPGVAPGSTEAMEGENMGGWWPEYSSPAPGVRATGQFTPACTRSSTHSFGTLLFCCLVDFNPSRWRGHTSISVVRVELWSIGLFGDITHRISVGMDYLCVSAEFLSFVVVALVLLGLIWATNC